MAKGHHGKQKRSQHRVERDALSSTGLTNHGRRDRRNAAKQQRDHARSVKLSAHRAAAGLQGAPKVITIVAAGSTADTAAVAAILACQGFAVPGGDGSTIMLPKQRQRISPLCPVRNIEAVLDAAKVADVLLLVIPVEGGLDSLGEQTIDALCMQGIGTVAAVLQGVEKLPQHEQNSCRKTWAASLSTRFPSHSRLISQDLDANGSQLIRHLTSLTPRPITWRASTPYVLSHAHTYEGGDAAASSSPVAARSPAAVQPGETAGTLRLCGYVRGAPLSFDRAVHVPGVGDVLPSSIEVLTDPNPLPRAAALRAAEAGRSTAHSAIDQPAAMAGGAAADGSALSSLVMDTSVAETTSRLLLSSGARMKLEYQVEGDGLGGEQTWPSAAEMEEAEAEAKAVGRARARAVRPRDKGEAYIEGWYGSAASEEECEKTEAEEVGEAAMGAAEREGEEIEFDAAGVAGEGEGEVAARSAWLARRAAREMDAKFPDEVMLARAAPQTTPAPTARVCPRPTSLPLIRIGRWTLLSRVRRASGSPGTVVSNRGVPRRGTRRRTCRPSTAESTSSRTIPPCRSTR